MGSWAGWRESQGAGQGQSGLVMSSGTCYTERFSADICFGDTI